VIESNVELGADPTGLNREIRYATSGRQCNKDNVTDERKARRPVRTQSKSARCGTREECISTCGFHVNYSKQLRVYSSTTQPRLCGQDLAL
jgi:hypothetical protein